MHIQTAVMLSVSTAQRLLIKERLAQRLVLVSPEQLQHPVFAGRQTAPVATKGDIAAPFVELQAIAL